MNVTSVNKLIEGALAGNLDKVKIYGEHIAKELEKDGNTDGARMIRDTLNEKSKKSLATLDKSSHKW